MGDRWSRWAAVTAGLALCAATAVPAQAATSSEAKPWPVVGKMTTWVPNLPKAVWKGGRALTFTIDTRQTSKDIVIANWYIGMFDASTLAGANSENRGVTVRWQNPWTKQWEKAYDIDKTGGWSVGPRAGRSLTHDKTLRLQIKIWFGKTAWAGRWQMEAIVGSYSVYTPAGKNIAATLTTPNDPQYLFTVHS